MLKKKFARILLLLISFVWIISCEDPTEIGGELFDDESFEIVPIDSFTVDLATIRGDSFRTDGATRFLAGFYKDDLLGSIRCSPFFQIRLDSTETIEEASTVFDSITFAFNYDGYHYFNQGTSINLSLYRLSEDLESESNLLFNTSSFRFDAEPLVSFSYTPDPDLEEDEIEIRLPDTLGREIYNFYLEGNEIVTENDQFMNWFKGLVIVPDTTNSSCIMGATPSSAQVRLYYRNTEETPNINFVQTFSADNEATAIRYFNQIITDYNNSVLSIFTDPREEDVRATNSGGKAFVQAGARLGARFEFPGIRGLLEIEGEFIVTEAILRFGPADDPGTGDNSLPETLVADILNRNNELIGPNFGSANLQNDDEFGRDTYYELDVTNYVIAQIRGELSGEDALVFRTQSANASSVERLIIDPEAENIEPELTIFLLKTKL